MRTCARDPSMSKGASTWSKGMEAFSRSNSGACSVAKRPPHGLAGRRRSPAAPAAGGRSRVGSPVGSELRLALVLARPHLDRQAPQLDEALGRLVAEGVARAVGGQLACT